MKFHLLTTFPAMLFHSQLADELPMIYVGLTQLHAALEQVFRNATLAFIWVACVRIEVAAMRVVSESEKVYECVSVRVCVTRNRM